MFKNKIFNKFMLIVGFSLFSTAFIMPVKEAHAGILSGIMGAIKNSDSSNNMPMMNTEQNFDTAKSEIQDNNYVLPDNLDDSTKGDNLTYNLEDPLKDNLNQEVKSDSPLLDFLNDTFGNDDLIFFKDGEGNLSFLSNNNNEGFGNSLTNALANSLLDGVSDITNPLTSIGDDLSSSIATIGSDFFASDNKNSPNSGASFSNNMDVIVNNDNSKSNDNQSNNFDISILTPDLSRDIIEHNLMDSINTMENTNLMENNPSTDVMEEGLNNGNFDSLEEDLREFNRGQMEDMFNQVINNSVNMNGM